MIFRISTKGEFLGSKAVHFQKCTTFTIRIKSKVKNPYMENLGLVLNRDRDFMAGMGVFWSWALFSFLQKTNWDVNIFRLYREISGFDAFFFDF